MLAFRPGFDFVSAQRALWLLQEAGYPGIQICPYPRSESRYFLRSPYPLGAAGHKALLSPSDVLPCLPLLLASLSSPVGVN